MEFKTLEDYVGHTPLVRLKRIGAGRNNVILAKLDWFRQGGELSERQWRDVLGVIKAQSPGLDEVYLRQWAGSLGVGDLLEQALVEAARDEA